MAILNYGVSGVVFGKQSNAAQQRVQWMVGMFPPK